MQKRGFASLSSSQFQQLPKNTDLHLFAVLFSSPLWSIISTSSSSGLRGISSFIAPAERLISYPPLRLAEEPHGIFQFILSFLWYTGPGNRFKTGSVTAHVETERKPSVTLCCIIEPIICIRSTSVPARLTSCLHKGWEAQVIRGETPSFCW